MVDITADAARASSPTAGAGDTMARRWAALSPYAERFGRAGQGPLVLLFHGCGGVREHLPVYARAAADLGCEAVIVDSYAARGWSRAFGLAFVCTGLMLHGRERAGDVLAAMAGLAGEGRAHRPVVLAGWSHGSWSIMDLMTMPLREWGEAGLADPDPSVFESLRGLFLAYPYGGVGALSRVRPWVRSAPVLAISPIHDHITSLSDARRLYAASAAAGCEVETWEPDATHSFDEPSNLFPMRFDPALRDACVDRFVGFLRRTCGL